MSIWFFRETAALPLCVYLATEVNIGRKSPLFAAKHLKQDVIKYDSLSIRWFPSIKCEQIHPFLFSISLVFDKIIELSQEAQMLDMQDDWWQNKTKGKIKGKVRDLSQNTYHIFLDFISLLMKTFLFNISNET